jgi:hypothetical protein
LKARSTNDGEFIEDLRRLREEALAEMERQGYEVRGEG